MHELEVPLPFARLQIDGDEAFGKQIVTRSIGAKVVAGGAFDRQVGDAELRIDADLSPGSGVAGVGPRILQPRLVAELTWLRDGVEDPQPLACPTSNPRMYPLTFVLPVGTPPDRCAAPTTTTLPATIGVE